MTNLEFLNSLNLDELKKYVTIKKDMEHYKFNEKELIYFLEEQFICPPVFYSDEDPTFCIDCCRKCWFNWLHKELV